MPGAFLRPIQSESVRELQRVLWSRITRWPLLGLDAQPWGRHTPIR